MDQQNQSPSPIERGSATPEGADQASKAAGINRRTLLRGGAAASPILLTLASGPVAATGTCVVASSFVSATVYQSRNPGSTNIACIPKTAKNYCDEAKTNSYSSCSWNPHNVNISTYMTCATNEALCAGWTSTTKCYEVFRNFGYGLHNQGDVAILQRLMALSYGAPTFFTKDYCKQVWAARNNPYMLATLVNDGSNDWDQSRLLTWLDYSANGVTF